jgi:RNA polymerase sigma factor (sigma-70 family)
MVTAHLHEALRHLRGLGDTQALSAVSDVQLLDWFIRGHEEAPFAALVRRHGPMVWSVARRVLASRHDAEDVFQATFLVLARKASVIHKCESVGSFLHGVAHRLALKTRQEQARRQAREQLAADRQQSPREGESTLSEVQAALDRALGELPEKYRAALVLCYLEGHSQDEAARRLGCPLATLRTRVARGRALLRTRLARHGLTLSGAGVATLLIASTAPAAVPAALLEAAVVAALPYAAGQAAASVCSPQVASLVEQGVKAMLLSRVKTATMLLLLAAGLVAAAAALARQTLAATEQPVASPKSEVRGQKTAADDKSDSVEVSGRVVAPDGKPFAGAKVYFAHYIQRDPPAGPAAVSSDAEGRFRLRVSRTGYPEKFMKAVWMQGAVVAVGQGNTFGWAGADHADQLTNVTIRLSRDVPITGRVLDLQGKPIAGVSVQVRGVRVRQDGGDLKDLVARLQKKQAGPNHPDIWLHPAPLGVARPLVTDSDGKFRITGIRGECLVRLRFAGPTIETAEVYAMTRPTPTIVTPRVKERPDLGRVVFHGHTFDHAAAPTRVIAGVVRDRDTGQPLKGVTVRGRLGSPKASRFVAHPYLETTTDGQGRYRLVGLSREGGHRLDLFPPSDQPYLRAARKSPAGSGLDPVRMDFRLKRGVVIRGRVTYKETGRPVAARVQYLAFADNAYLKEAAGFSDSEEIVVRTAADGSFTLLGLPGQGVVVAAVADFTQAGRYLMACGLDQVKGKRYGNDLDTVPTLCDPRQYNALVEVRPARDARSIIQDIVFDPGRTVSGTIVGPDGKPVTGVTIDSAFGVWFEAKDLPTATFRIPGIDPKHPRAFWFRHRGQNLGAAVVLRGDERMPVTVRLQKCATLTGRLVDDDGQPRTSWLAGGLLKGQLGSTGVGFFTARSGKDGRFRIEGIIPGLTFDLWAGKTASTFDQNLVPKMKLEPGQVKDLGEFKRKES